MKKYDTNLMKCIIFYKPFNGSSIRNRDNEIKFKKLHLKKVEAHTMLSLFDCKINNEICKFHRFFKCNFLSQNLLLPLFLKLLKCTRSIFTNF